jgi:hypothetical protein
MQRTFDELALPGPATATTLVIERNITHRWSQAGCSYASFQACPMSAIGSDGCSMPIDNRIVVRRPSDHLLAHIANDVSDPGDQICVWQSGDGIHFDTLTARLRHGRMPRPARELSDDYAADVGYEARSRLDPAENFLFRRRSRPASSLSLTRRAAISQEASARSWLSINDRIAFYRNTSLECYRAANLDVNLKAN